MGEERIRNECMVKHYLEETVECVWLVSEEGVKGSHWAKREI